MQAEPKEVSADKATTPGQQAPQWTHAKPTGPGAYWVRGFRIGEAAVTRLVDEMRRKWKRRSEWLT